jgi:hypothetical protein
MVVTLNGQCFVKPDGSAERLETATQYVGETVDVPAAAN